jgi:hypothetical protein
MFQGRVVEKVDANHAIGLRQFPASPEDLQTQKKKLKPVPANIAPANNGDLMEELNAALKSRRVSICHSDQDEDGSVESEDWRD